MNRIAHPLLICALLLLSCKKEKEDTRLRAVEYKIVGDGHESLVLQGDGAEVGLLIIDHVARFEEQMGKGTHVRIRTTGLYSDADFTAIIIVDGSELTRSHGHGIGSIVAEGTVP